MTESYYVSTTRIVTAGRVNSGLEDLADLTQEQVYAVMAGNTVVIEGETKLVTRNNQGEIIELD